MTRVLTVDDSKAIRTIITKQLAEMAFEVDEAEDGLQGLAKLDEVIYDLVLLDVTMPNLDGPGMLTKMREAGHKTPVLMLTSESKRSIMVEIMKQGIDDYILKPFKPEELKAKVLKLMAPQQKPGQPGAPAAGTARVDTSGKQFIDLLVIDDMENVAKKLKSMVPAHVTLNAATSASAALTQARGCIYRVIFVDTDIPEVNSAALMNQLRTLQQHAAFFALTLRGSADAQKEMQALGFDDVLFKPFDKDSVEDFLMRYFNDQALVTAEENVLKVGAFTGKEDRMEKYFTRVAKLLEEHVERMADACFDQAIVDITLAPLKSDKTTRLVLDLKKDLQKRGLDFRLVASPECVTLLKKFDETSGLKIASTVEEAQRAA